MSLYDVRKKYVSKEAEAQSNQLVSSSYIYIFVVVVVVVKCLLCARHNARHLLR